MAKAVFEFSDEELRTVISGVLESKYGLSCSPDRFRQILFPKRNPEKHLDVAVEILWALNSQRSSNSFSLDTIIREQLLDIIAEEIVGQHWPYIGSSQEESDDFFKSLFELAGSKGFILSEKKKLSFSS